MNQMGIILLHLKGHISKSLITKYFNFFCIILYIWFCMECKVLLKTWKLLEMHFSCLYEWNWLVGDFLNTLDRDECQTTTVRRNLGKREHLERNSVFTVTYSLKVTVNTIHTSQVFSPDQYFSGSLFQRQVINVLETPFQREFKHKILKIPCEISLGGLIDTIFKVGLVLRVTALFNMLFLFIASLRNWQVFLCTGRQAEEQRRQAALWGIQKAYFKYLK